MDFELDQNTLKTGCFFPCSVCKHREEDFEKCKASCSLHRLSSLDADEIAHEVESIIQNVNKKEWRTA